jgi:hypothetical protein
MAIHYLNPFENQKGVYYLNTRLARIRMVTLWEHYHIYTVIVTDGLNKSYTHYEHVISPSIQCQVEYIHWLAMDNFSRELHSYLGVGAKTNLVFCITELKH